MSIHRNIIRLTLVTLTLSLSLAVPASEPPAQPKEGFGVFLVVLSQTAAGAAADDGKLDVAAYGGTLLEERDNILVVTLPLEGWPRVESHSRVSYVQRVWMGEPREQWEAQRRTERRPRAATQSMESLPEAASWDSAPYAYDGSGNITAIGDDHYSYDTAGRIAQAWVDGVPEQYGYDAFGNLTSKRTNGNPSPIPPIDPSSNRLIGYPYDEAGNVTSLPGGGGTWEHASSYTYDALGMPVHVQGHTDRSPHRMIYTADDERLALMNIGNDAQIWVRGFDGKVLREYRGNLLAGYWTWKQDYVWAGGQLVSAEREEVNGGRLHFHLDHLGSVRLITKRDQTRLSSHEFFPFGVERTDSVSEVRNFDIENNRVEPMKFTGHERDFYGLRNVDGTDYLDYMHARYYDANMGRFLSVDPGGYFPERPQSWNRYTYALNNPVLNTDPDGRCVAALPCPGWVATGTRTVVTQVGSRAAAGSAAGPVGVAVASAGITGWQIGRGIGTSTIGGQTIDSRVTDLFVKGIALGQSLASSEEADLTELPARDRTGKVHGDLPTPADLQAYPTEELQHFQDELKGSVGERIKVTSQLGREQKHGERQGAEQKLIKQIDRIIKEREPK